MAGILRSFPLLLFLSTPLPSAPDSQSDAVFEVLGALRTLERHQQRNDVALNTFMLAGVKQLLADLERNPTFANAEVADNLVGPLLARAAMQRLAADIAKHGVSVRTLIEQRSDAHTVEWNEAQLQGSLGAAGMLLGLAETRMLLRELDQDGDGMLGYDEFTDGLDRFGVDSARADASTESDGIAAQHTVLPVVPSPDGEAAASTESHDDDDGDLVPFGEAQRPAKLPTDQERQTEWGRWSGCSVSCGHGARLRSRIVLTNSSDAQSYLCIGLAQHSKFCRIAEYTMCDESCTVPYLNLMQPVNGARLDLNQPMIINFNVGNLELDASTIHDVLFSMVIGGADGEKHVLTLKADKQTRQSLKHFGSVSLGAKIELGSADVSRWYLLTLVCKNYSGFPAFDKLTRGEMPNDQPDPLQDEFSECTGLRSAQSWIFSLDAKMSLGFEKVGTVPPRPDELYPVRVERLQGSSNISSLSLAPEMRNAIPNAYSQVYRPRGIAERARVEKESKLMRKLSGEAIDGP